MEQRIVLGGRRQIGGDAPVLVIAEIGQNHNGCRAWAEQLIDAAAFGGADAVKLVKRDIDCELARQARVREYRSIHSFGTTYAEHRRTLELTEADHRALACRAGDHGLLYIGTACDRPSAAMFETLGVDAFKIASRDLSNLPLIEYLAQSGRPLLLSTGMSDWQEIDAAVAVVRRHAAPFVLMHCTSLYPAPAETLRLRRIPAMEARYGAPVGFSDHSLGRWAAVMAVALGAVVVEKHLTLDRGLKGTDHGLSLEPDQLRLLVEEVREARRALGTTDKELPPGIEAVRARLGRSVYARVPIPAGTRLASSMLCVKSPGDGLTWREGGSLIGRRALRDLEADDRLDPDDFE